MAEQKQPNTEGRDEDDFNFAVMPGRDSRSYESQGTPGSIPNGSGNSQGGNILHNKVTYLIVGALVLLTLGALAFFLLGSKDKDKDQTLEVTTSKMPKIFLQRYFGAELCTIQGRCGDSADPDEDGLNNYDEFLQQTDPTLNDTDSDGLADGDEVHVYHTKPNNAFTDAVASAIEKGYNDGSQIKAGFDPFTNGIKMTKTRLDQIADSEDEYGLHEPTVTFLAAPQSKTVNVSIVAGKFDPTPLTVNLNDTVVWLNKDTASHQITPDSGQPDATTMASGSLATNQTFSFKFVKLGTFNYHDNAKPDMKGTVIVK